MPNPCSHACGWTDERAALAINLWKAGVAASDIAKRLGGITRNAVIGKIHRMGAADTAPRHKRSTQNGPRKRPLRRRIPAQPRFEAMFAERAALSAVAEERQAAQLGPDLIIPSEERKTLMDLEADSCRWPFGDPKQPDFHFCNGKAVSGLPYCKFHADRAYRPPYVPVYARVGDRTRALDEFDAMERA